ncbi:hypothetical protein AB0I60_25255 [Actinosynnema sp. NPDC050436]|uniref:hypothetical protein n=1 Tax=Actinosynnema sp. NPDC050436 TaxID=3155659 RepID=UPI003409D84A
MTKTARVLTTAAAVATAALALGGGVAQAVPNTVYLYTSSNATCTQIGSTGVANGVFDSYECKSGVAGYSTLVDPTSGSLTNAPVWTAPLSECTTVGSNGQANGAWTSYYCQLGIAGYTLLVSR